MDILAKGVEFITEKFDEYEKDRREKDTIIATLQNELRKTSMKVEDLEKKKWKGKNSTLGEIAF